MNTEIIDLMLISPTQMQVWRCRVTRPQSIIWNAQITKHWENEHVSSALSSPRIDQIWDFGPLIYCRNTLKHTRENEIIFENLVFLKILYQILKLLEISVPRLNF